MNLLPLGSNMINKMLNYVLFLEGWKCKMATAVTVLAVPVSMSRTQSHGSPQPRTILPTLLSIPVRRF